MLIKRMLTLMMVVFLSSLPLVFAQEDEQENEESEEASAEIPSDVDGYMRLDNSGNDSLRIIDTGGDGVYARSDTSTVYLDVGQEYYIDLSNIDSERFPLDIKNRRGEILISQRDDIDKAEIEGIEASVEEEGIRFVLTEELAKEISIFRAASYPQMVGFFSPVLEDDEQQEEDEAAAEEEEEE
ncbi:MAG: hypothetical protein ACLFQW_04090 [Spirochaetaceae bacterium]